MRGSSRMSGTTEPTGREPDPDLDLGSTSKQTNDGVLRLEQPFVGLLPGILDDITHVLIFPKLSWRTLIVLSSLNSAWRQAIQSYFDDRLLSLAMETGVQIERFIVRGSKNRLGFSLRSKVDGFNYKLPPIRNAGMAGFPLNYQCVFLNGKVYALQRRFREVCFPGGKLHVMDLAGSKQWERCKSMPHAQPGTKILAAEGKICVWEGAWEGHGSLAENILQVYYPESNTWDIQRVPGSEVAWLDSSYDGRGGNPAWKYKFRM